MGLKRADFSNGPINEEVFDYSFQQINNNNQNKSSAFIIKTVVQSQED